MDFDPYDNKFYNDIIILKLKGILVFSQNKVHEVSLPLEKTWGIDESLEDCMISGWGRTTQHKSSRIPKILQWASVPTIANCNSVSNYTNLIESQICAGDLINGKTDSCGGDSGGPLVCKSGFSGYVMTGVVSYGPKNCGTPGTPGVYTRVGYFLEWIKDNMEKPGTIIYIHLFLMHFYSNCEVLFDSLNINIYLQITIQITNDHWIAKEF